MLLAEPFAGCDRATALIGETKNSEFGFGNDHGMGTFGFPENGGGQDEQGAIALLPFMG